MLTRKQVRDLVSDCRASVAPKLADGHAVAAGAFATATRALEQALCDALPPDLEPVRTETTHVTSAETEEED